jgi:hypothetical protein
LTTLKSKKYSQRQVENNKKLRRDSMYLNRIMIKNLENRGNEILQYIRNTFDKKMIENLNEILEFFDTKKGMEPMEPFENIFSADFLKNIITTIINIQNESKKG